MNSPFLLLLSRCCTQRWIPTEPSLFFVKSMRSRVDWCVALDHNMLWRQEEEEKAWRSLVLLTSRYLIESKRGGGGKGGWRGGGGISSSKTNLEWIEWLFLAGHVSWWMRPTLFSSLRREKLCGRRFSFLSSFRVRQILLFYSCCGVGESLHLRFNSSVRERASSMV